MYILFTGSTQLANKLLLTLSQVTVLALVLVVPLLFTVPQAQADASQAQPVLPSVTLRINSVALQAELAGNGQQRFMGLSFRQLLADNSGMLFVYEREQPLVFTMRNTLLPLSIAFISADFVINEIQLMNVGPDQLFPSRIPARYALEVNQGWFAQHGIKPGMQIRMR